MSGGTENTLRLSNVPYDLNGWLVYCRFSNESGNVDTASAMITVNAVTPAPAQEYVPVYAASDYAGTYYSGRATMDILGGPTSYIVDITWGGSAYEYSEWSFTGTVDSQGVLYYNNCQKATFTVDEDGNETYVIDYNNGSGCIYSDYTSGMCWDDYEEGVADGMSFNR